MNLSHDIKFKFRADKDRIFFPDADDRFKRSRCTWRDDKTAPCYCAQAHLKFETSLPDRKYLTRFSVRCLECYESGISAVHLYCAYCDEILTGSIAGPGGKISDHLITIRHVYQQALALKESLESGSARSLSLPAAQDYIVKLEKWSERVRYPVRTSVKKFHLDQVLHDFHRHLEQLRPPPSARVRLIVNAYHFSNCNASFCQAVMADFSRPPLDSRPCQSPCRSCRTPADYLSVLSSTTATATGGWSVQIYIHAHDLKGRTSFLRESGNSHLTCAYAPLLF